MARAGFFRLWSQIERLRPEGFEPPTYGSEDRCSIQLSYGRKSSLALPKGKLSYHRT